MKSEKAIISAKDYGSNTELTDELTKSIQRRTDMNNNNPNPNNFQPNSRRELLEQTKLSRLPKLPPRPPFGIPAKTAAPSCVGCNGRLDHDDNFQQSTSVCRKCLSHYARIDAALEEKEKRERKKILEKFAEVK